MHTEKIKQFWEWVKQTFTPAYQREVEHYLAEAVDVIDLEQRMRTLAYRGML